MRNPIIAFTLLLALLLMPTAAWSQDDALPVQVITLPELPVYAMELAPKGDVVAVYVNLEAQILFRIPALGYEVDPLLLPIRLIDLNTGEEVRRLPGSTDYISDVAFSANGDILASHHRNGDIILWDVATGDIIRSVTTIPNGEGIAFMPDDTTLLVHSRGLMSMFLVVDSESGAITQIVRHPFDSFGELDLEDALGRLDYSYNSWTLSPDGGTLATASGNGEVILWDTATHAQTVLLPRAEELGHLNVRPVLFSPDGSTLVYYDRDDEQTHFWDVATLTETATIAGGERTLAVTDDLKQIAWATRDDVWLVDVNDPQNARQILVFDEGLLSIASLAFTPDGGRLVVGGFGADVDSRTADNLLYVIELK